MYLQINRIPETTLRCLDVYYLYGETVGSFCCQMFIELGMFMFIFCLHMCKTTLFIVNAPVS